MATISTASIQDGLIVYAEHPLRIISALNGSASNSIIITGDLTQGSLNNVTDGATSFAQGSGSTASGLYSFAEGQDTVASGDYSHAEGGSTTASDIFAHSEGVNTIASGVGSHAEGESTEAQGASSHAEGYNTLAVGDYSHAEGLGTIATAYYQLAVGQYNKDSNNTDYFVVGYGTGSSAGARADALGVNASGSYISSSFFLPTLTTSSQTDIVIYDTTTKQVHYTSSANLVVSRSLLADTASFVTASNIWGPYGSNSILTASYALKALDIFPYTGSAIITGSLVVTGSVSFRNEEGGSPQIINFLSGSNTNGYALNIGLGNNGVNIFNNSSQRGFNFGNASGTLFSIDRKSVV